LPPAPSSALFATNARLPLPLRRFRPGGLPGEGSDPPLRIMFPPNGARLELAAGSAAEPIALKVSGGAQPLTVLVDGVPITTAPDRRRMFFAPQGPGFVRLTVMDAKGAADSVVVRMQ
jgi:penicillin-binding protein 1C